MDDAVRDMPRTSHRLYVGITLNTHYSLRNENHYNVKLFYRLIFKHRVITKAKLGEDVQFDMGKFKVRSTQDVLYLRVVKKMGRTSDSPYISFI